MTNTHKGLLAVNSASLIFGLTALFSKLINLSALDISTIRSLIAALFIGIAILILDGKNTLSLNNKKDYAIAFIIGLLLALHWVTYFHAMQISSIAVGVIALYTFPIMTVFLEPLFHGEKPHFKDVVSALIVIFGIYLMIPEFSLNNQTTQGLVWGLLSAFLFSIRNIMQGHYFKSYSARQSLFYQTLVTFIVLVPFTIDQINMVTFQQWQMLFILGILFTALPHILFAFSLLNLKAKTVSLVACIQVAYASLFALIILNEIPNNSVILGGLIIVLTAMYESYTTNNKR